MYLNNYNLDWTNYKKLENYILESLFFIWILFQSLLFFSTYSNCVSSLDMNGFHSLYLIYQPASSFLVFHK